MSIRVSKRVGLGFTRNLGLGIHAEGENNGGGGFSTSFSDLSSGLFGSDASGSTSANSDVKRTQFSDLFTTDRTAQDKGSSTSKIDKTTKQLQIDKAGLLELIDKALRAGASGIEGIFGKEKGAGLFRSSGAKKGTEDLLSKIAGELALATGKEVTSNTGSVLSGEQTRGFNTGSKTEAGVQRDIGVQSGTSSSESKGILGFLGL